LLDNLAHNNCIDGTVNHKLQCDIGKQRRVLSTTLTTGRYVDFRGWMPGTSQ